MKFAVILHPVVTVFPHVFVQFSNSKSHCAVSVFGVAVTVVDQIITLFPLIEIHVQYGTVTEDLSTVHEFILFDTISTTYWLISHVPLLLWYHASHVSVYCAVYVLFHVAAAGVGVQLLNV